MRVLCGICEASGCTFKVAFGIVVRGPRFGDVREPAGNRGVPTSMATQLVRVDCCGVVDNIAVQLFGLSEQILGGGSVPSREMLACERNVLSRGRQNWLVQCPIGCAATRPVHPHDVLQLLVDGVGRVLDRIETSLPFRSSDVSDGSPPR
jgi:hypothetical protein